MNIFLITVFFFTLIFHGGGTVSFLLFLKIFGFSFICAITGGVLLKLAKVNDIPCRNLLAVLIGSFFSSLFINALSQTTGISALYSFICLSILVLLPTIFLYPSIFKENMVLTRNNMADSLVLFGIILFIFAWGWDVSLGFYALKNTGILHAWEDYYFHGVQIAQFSDAKAVGSGDILLAGAPLTVYHRAIYMLPAVLAQLAHLPGVSASTSILLPFGILLMCIAIYALGTQLAGRTAGILAVLSLIVLPDSSLYWFKNGFLGFHYLLRAAPGTGYGIAVCLTSLIFFIQGTRHPQKGLWALCLLLAVSSFFFRAHLFALYFPVFIFMLVLHAYWHKKWFQRSLLFASISLVLLTIVACFSQSIRAIFFEKSAVLPFLELVHLQRGENAYGALFKTITDMHRPAITIVTGIAFLLFAILSAWLIAFLLAFVSQVKNKGFKLIDIFPIGILLFYMAIVLFFPPVHGLVDEWQHRSFGLLYAIIVIFTVAYSVKYVEYTQHAQSDLIKSMPMYIITTCILGILVAVSFPSAPYISKLFTGASLYGGEYRIPVNNDVLKTSLYLRENALRGDVFVISHVDAAGALVDSAMVITSITGVPAYAANFALVNMPGFVKSDLINERISFMKLISNANNLTQAYSLLRSKNISWYVALTPPQWDKAEKHSTFKSGPVALYHVSS